MTAMIAIDLRKQRALYPDPKAIPKINFRGNLARQGNAHTRMFLKEVFSGFSQGTMRTFWLSS